MVYDFQNDRGVKSLLEEARACGITYEVACSISPH